MNPAAGLLGTQQYRLNSIFDPDLTATGHQPMLRDTMALLYATYVVEKCHLEVEFFSNVPTFWIFRGANTSTVPTNATLEGERVDSAFLSTTTNWKEKYSHTYSIPHVLGIGEDQLYESDNQTALGTNPAVPFQAFLNIAAGAINVTDSPLCYVKLKLVYTVLFTQLLVNQSQS